MRGFDEAWLREYEAKMSRQSGELPDFRFTLQRPFVLLNPMLRMHWARRRAYAAALSAEIAAATPNLPAGAKPMQRARVTVTRYSLGEPDHDGLVGGAKWLVDSLLVRSERHPNGLGFLADDSPAHLDLIVRSEVVTKRRDQRTTVLIERIANTEAA